MLSDKSTVCPNNLLDIAHQKRGIKAAIVNAGKELPMLSVMDAVKEKLIVPVLIGDEGEIKKIAEELKFDISDYEIVHEPIENNTAKGCKPSFFPTNFGVKKLDSNNCAAKNINNISYLYFLMHNLFFNLLMIIPTLQKEYNN